MLCVSLAFTLTAASTSIKVMGGADFMGRKGEEGREVGGVRVKNEGENWGRNAW